jgi:UDP-glucose 4-epimerase
MKALVTGGLGFLGSHLVDKLLCDKHSVIIVDNMTTNSIDDDLYKNLNNCSFIMSNVSDYNPNESFDVVFHLASVVGPAGVLNHAGNIGYSIMEDTKKIMNICIQQNALLILISTSEVYGRDGIFTEDTHKIVPGKVAVRTEYGVGKLLAEVSIINKAQVTDLKYHIIRPFNISGPRQRSLGGFVLPRFIEQAIKNEPITVFGDGTQQRAFTHVYDIVDGILKIAYSHFATFFANHCAIAKAQCLAEKIDNEIWNIGNIMNLTTITNLAQIVKRVTNSKSEIIYVDPKNIYGPLYEEAFDKLPNIGKIQKRLNWNPKYDLETIVKDTYEYYQNLRTN